MIKRVANCETSTARIVQQQRYDEAASFALQVSLGQITSDQIIEFNRDPLEPPLSLFSNNQISELYTLALTLAADPNYHVTNADFPNLSREFHSLDTH